jgi:hypothetical protein
MVFLLKPITQASLSNPITTGLIKNRPGIYMKTRLDRGATVTVNRNFLSLKAGRNSFGNIFYAAKLFFMRENLFKSGILLFITFLSLNAFSQVINEMNFQSSGWDKFPNPTTKLNFVCGPEIPPAGRGSLELISELQTDRVRFRTNNLDNTFLKDITELKYWTYVTFTKNNNAPILTLQIDIDGITGIDYNINFVPKTSGEVKLEWQPWDALNGVWSFYDAKQLLFVNPFTGEPITDLSKLKDNSASFAVFLKDDRFKNAKIITDPSVALAGKPAGGGLRFTAGGGNLAAEVADEWKGFKGNVDALKIGRNGQNFLFYDFETTSCHSTIEQALCLNYPGLIRIAPATSNSSFTWTITTGPPSPITKVLVGENKPYLVITPSAVTATSSPLRYTLTEKTSEGAVFTTTVKVEVYDGICPDKIENWWIHFLKNYGIGIIAAIVIIWVCFRIFRNIRNQRSENIKY